MSQGNAHIIVKRRKPLAEAEQHRGVWKIAYADFVTAMMAFFLLMWLLNSTTERQRKGLSDYFNPSLAENRTSGGGEGMLWGDSSLSQDTLAESGSGGLAAEGEAMPAIETAEDDAEVLRGRVEESLRARLATEDGGAELFRHIDLRATDEGLVIELHDLEHARLFLGETDRPQALAVHLARVVVDLLREHRNPLAIGGHVRGMPVPYSRNPVWDLSSDRARAMRILLENAGLSPGRITRVTGHADRRPVAPDRGSVRNNRVEITLLLRRP